MDFQKIIGIVAAHATTDRPIYLVGGSVRDRVLGRESHDLDFVMRGRTRSVARRVADQAHGAYYLMDEERDTSRVVVQQSGEKPTVLDFSTMRADTLEGDLQARDFRINAMALDVTNLGELIDPLDGMKDLSEKRIQVCGPTSLADDPLRVLRCVRLANELHFRIDPHTLELALQAAGAIGQVSTERQRDELFKMLESDGVSTAVHLLDNLGALDPILPELKHLKGVEQSAPHVYDVWKHTLRGVRHLEALLKALGGEDSGVHPWTLDLAVEYLGRYQHQIKEHLSICLAGDRSLRSLLFLAAIYHDIAKPQTKQVEKDGRVRFLDHENQGTVVAGERARRLALSNDEVERLKRIVSGHMRVHFLVNSGSEPSSRAIYRFFRDTGEGGIDVCLLSLADVLATYGDTLSKDIWVEELKVCRTLLEARWEQVEELVNPPRLVSGSDLINELGMKPGPIFGQLLEAIREAQVDGMVITREEALDFARRWISTQDGIS